ncbi:hypothetical protein T484DRAFT_1826621 [Baffinella frigidus]|nr:hypothetical protein T484DRAFT_1826621 [Cryptophyta sp. CCMP2293]
MLQAIGLASQKKSTEEENSIEALLAGRPAASGSADDDCVSPLPRSNSFDPAMAEGAARDRPRGILRSGSLDPAISRGIPRSGSFDPAIPRGMVHSGSFDTAMLPHVSLSSFLDYEDFHTSRPPLHANRLNDTPTNHQRKTPPPRGNDRPLPPLMSPARQAAIVKCLAAIEDVKAKMAQCSTEDGSFHACPQQKSAEEDMSMEALLAGRSAASGSANDDHFSPLPRSNSFDPAMAVVAAYDRPQGIPRRGSFDPATLPTVSLSFPLRAGLAHGAGSSPISVPGSLASPLADFRPGGAPAVAEHSSEHWSEGVMRWLDGTTDEPPPYRTLTPPAVPRAVPEALGDASWGDASRGDASWGDASWEPRGQTQGVFLLAGGSTHARGEREGGERDGGARVYRTTPYVRRGSAPVPRS